MITSHPPGPSSLPNTIPHSRRYLLSSAPYPRFTSDETRTVQCKTRRPWRSPLLRYHCHGIPSPWHRSRQCNPSPSHPHPYPQPPFQPYIESVTLVSAHLLLPAPHPLHDTLALPPRQRAPLHHAVQRVSLHDPADPKSLSLLPSQAPHLPCLSDSARVFIGTADHRSRTSEARPSRPSRPHVFPARGFSRGFAAGGEVWSAPRHGTLSWACSAEGGLEAERGCCTRVEGKIGRT